jgi:hypothetical protein
MNTNYNEIPLSSKTTKGMSLTIDDQKWIKLLFDRQDEVTQDFISDTVKKAFDEIRIELRNIHVEIKSINVEIKCINTDIADIRKVLINHELRLTKIENKLQL